MSRDGWLLVESDGTLRRCDGPARDGVPAALGHPLQPGRGLTRVQFDAGTVGWIHDTARWLPRNPVGSCLLVALGGPWEVVGGPVAVTGWDEGLVQAATATTAGRTVDLSPGRMFAVEFLHADIVAILGGWAGDRPAEWVTEMRAFAAHVEEAAELPRDVDRGATVVAAQDQARRFLAGDVF